MPTVLSTCHCGHGATGPVSALLGPGCAANPSPRPESPGRSAAGRRTGAASLGSGLRLPPTRYDVGLASHCPPIRVSHDWQCRGATGLPVDQAVRVSTCEALFHSLPGSLLAEFSDEIPPRRRVRHQCDLVVCQPIQLSIRVWGFAIIAWVEPSRLRAYRPLFFHALPRSFRVRVANHIKPVLGVALNCRQARRAVMVRWLRQVVNGRSDLIVSVEAL